MDYLSVTYPGGTRLGMSIVNRDDPATPVLGNTVVDSVEAAGHSADGGVQRGDFIVSVNEQYVAFDANLDVVHLLQGVIKGQRELVIVFARPNHFHWEQILKTPHAAVKEGMVNKLHQGIFKKWNARTLKVTRETLSYSYDGVLKGKYSVEAEVGAPRVAVGYPLAQGVFEVHCGEKDFVLQTNSTRSRNMWMHAIQCAANKAFEGPLRGRAAAGAGVGAASAAAGAGVGAAAGRGAAGMVQSPTSRSTRMTGANGHEMDAGTEAYLRMGRAALMRQQGNGGAGAGGPGAVGTAGAGRAASASASASANSNPNAVYKMLGLSKVQAVAGPDNVVSLDGIKDPSSMSPALVDYDFHLENSILEAAAATTATAD